MKLLMLSPAESVHTQRWCRALSQKGINVVLFSFSAFKGSFYKKYNITVYSCNINARTIWEKKNYLFTLLYLRQIIKNERPDIVHAHRASSYGLMGTLSGFHPLIISIWGEDIYDFPRKSPIFRFMLKFALKRADRLLSTSHVMAKEAKKYTDKIFSITPFGVDTKLFMPMNAAPHEQFVIGNVKILDKKYGIDVLIRAFSLVLQANPDKDLLLRIIGDGPCREEYESLVDKLNIKNNVEFLGRIPNDYLPQYYNGFSVSVSVSNSESFGVVAVEAMSCGCPVITSDADGFTEVVINGSTGFIVPKKNEKKTAEAIQKFIDDPSLRTKMGQAGRKRVLQFYDWNDNVNTMIDIYNSILSQIK